MTIDQNVKSGRGEDVAIISSNFNCDSRSILSTASHGLKTAYKLMVYALKAGEGVAGFDECNRVPFRFEIANTEYCSHFFDQFVK